MFFFAFYGLRFLLTINTEIVHPLYLTGVPFVWNWAFAVLLCSNYKAKTVSYRPCYPLSITPAL